MPAARWVDEVASAWLHEPEMHPGDGHLTVFWLPASSSTQQVLRNYVQVTPWETREALQLARDSMTDGEAHAHPKPIAQAMPAHAASL